MENWEFSTSGTIQNWEYSVVQLLESEGSTEIIVDGHQKVMLPWPTQIKYKQYNVIPDRHVEFLNEFGKDGWDMVSNKMTLDSLGHFYSFKRPLTE